MGTLSAADQRMQFPENGSMFPQERLEALCDNFKFISTQRRFSGEHSTCWKLHNCTLAHPGPITNNSVKDYIICILSSIVFVLELDRKLCNCTSAFRNYEFQKIWLLIHIVGARSTQLWLRAEALTRSFATASQRIHVDIKYNARH